MFLEIYTYKNFHFGLIIYGWLKLFSVNKYP